MLFIYLYIKAIWCSVRYPSLQPCFVYIKSPHVSLLIQLKKNYLASSFSEFITNLYSSLYIRIFLIYNLLDFLYQFVLFHEVHKNDSVQKIYIYSIQGQNHATRLHIISLYCSKSGTHASVMGSSSCPFIWHDWHLELNVYIVPVVVKMWTVHLTV